MTNLSSDFINGPDDVFSFDFDEGDSRYVEMIDQASFSSSEADSEPVDYILEPFDSDVLFLNTVQEGVLKLLKDDIDKFGDSEKEVLTIKLDLFLDSEYTIDQNLSCQLLLVIKDVPFKIIAINAAFRPFISPELEIKMRSEHDIVVLFLNLDDSSLIHLTSIFDHILPLIVQQSTKKIHWLIDLYFFYAVRDLSILFGLDAMLPLYKGERGTLRPRRGLSGFFQLEDSVFNKPYFFKYSVKIKDLVGIDVDGLLDIAKSCGLEMPDKGFFDGMKTHMDVALRQHPEKFLLYGIGDALILKEILHSKLASYNSILSSVYQIDSSDLLTKDSMPLTLGSIVNVVWETYLECIIYKKNIFVKLAMARFSLLSSSHPDYRRNLILYESLMRFSSLAEMSSYYFQHPNELSDMYDLLDKPGVFMYQPFQFASIKRFVDFSKDTTISVLAFRNGGRTNNEDPFNYVCHEGADPDIAGAYGSALMDGIYPFGRPRIFSYSSGEKTIKLGRFLKKYAVDLESGLYTIVVSGKLSFDQDLIYSKVVPQSSIYSKSDRFDPDRIETAEFSGDFVLLRREIINGFITKDLLYILKNVCTNLEFREIRDLDVVAAAFWSQKDRVDSIEELADSFLADKGRVSYEMATTSLRDTRTYSWYGFQLSSFIGPLMEKRAFFKKQKDPTSQAIQNSIKGIVNTFYGIVSSVFFPLNNMVVSNMVTARIRGAVWLLSKPLGLRMTICDGGFYEFSKTRFISSSSRLPGLASFSSFQSIEDHGSIRIAPLGDSSIDWHSLFSSKTPPEQFPNLDDLVTKHVNDFWSNYNLNIFFKIEHKVSNIFKKAGYIMKAHYAFLIYDSETQDYTKEKYKIRGLSLRDVHDPSIRHNPIYNIIEAMLLFARTKRQRLSRNLRILSGEKAT